MVTEESDGRVMQDQNRTRTRKKNEVSAASASGAGKTLRIRKTVTAAACPDYSGDSVRKAVALVLENWEGLSRIRPGVKVAVKVNLVSAASPDRAATTHPALVAELCRVLIARGAEVTVGDSPGGLFTREALKKIYRTCGMERVEGTGAKLNYDTSVQEAVFPEAVRAHVFSCTSWIRNADVIINFSKLKTHGMMRMTAAVKNLFGTIPGTTKPEYHMRFPNAPAFAGMLIDLNEYLRPALNLTDAVFCMEGNGPTAGTPRKLGLLLASESPYDLDMACAKLIGLKRADVPTLQAAYERGLGPEDFSQVRTAGEKIERYTLPDFRQADEINVTFTGNGILGRIGRTVFTGAMQQIPKVYVSECVGCARCAHVCPAKAITMEKNRPHINRKKCIRCFCCQEFCPKGAMKVHRTALAKLLQAGS